MIICKKRKILIKILFNAKKERDHWYKLWIEGFCSDETGDEYQAKMKEYGRKWKELERKMNEINPEYEPLL